MTTANLQPKFIKPFSKGQITLPKDYRDYLGIGNQSWLKIYLISNKIVIKPVEGLEEKEEIQSKIGSKAYRKALLKIKGNWFKEKELAKTREEVERRLEKNEKSFS